MHQRDQVRHAVLPRGAGQQVQGDLGDVHRRDPAAAARGQQRAAGRAAGQVGDGTVRQFQGQRQAGQRMRPR